MESSEVRAFSFILVGSTANLWRFSTLRHDLIGPCRPRPRRQRPLIAGPCQDQRRGVK